MVGWWGRDLADRMYDSAFMIMVSRRDISILSERWARAGPMLVCTPASGRAAKGDEIRGNVSALAGDDEDLDILECFHER